MFHKPLCCVACFCSVSPPQYWNRFLEQRRSEKSLSEDPAGSVLKRSAASCMLVARLTILKPLQDETVHTPKVLALASLCIPLGACVTAAVCTATLWSTSTDDKEAHIQGTAVVMQGKVRWECCLLHI